MFMEAQLDYFGAHSYDLKSEGAGEVKKGERLGSEIIAVLITDLWYRRTPLRMEAGVS